MYNLYLCRKLKQMLRIKEILKEKGVGVTELADRLNVSRQALSKQIQGKMLIETANKIALALDVPLWQLFASLEDVKGDDFIAVIRTNGQTHTFTSDVDLFDFVDELRGIKKHANIRGREYYQQKSSDDSY